MENGVFIIATHNLNVYNYFVLMEVLNRKEDMSGKILFQLLSHLHTKEQQGVYVMMDLLNKLLK